MTAIGGDRIRRSHPLVLPPAHRGRPDPRRAPLVPPARSGTHAPFASVSRGLRRADRRQPAAGAAHHRHRRPRAHSQEPKPSAPTPSCSSSPAPAGPRSSPTARPTSPKPPTSSSASSAPPAPRSAAASRSSTRAAKGSRASLPHPSQPGRPDRRHAAPSQGPLHLLPRRRAARRRLALHRRAPRHLPRPQLRLDPRQSRRRLRRRRLRRSWPNSTRCWNPARPSPPPYLGAPGLDSETWETAYLNQPCLSTLPKPQSWVPHPRDFFYREGGKPRTSTAAQAASAAPQVL